MTDTLRGADARLSVEIEAFGPTSDDLDRIAAEAVASAARQAGLGDGSHRLLSIAAIEPEEEDKPERPRAPERFRATVADYGRSRTLLVEGAVSDPSRVEIRETAADEPPVPDEEFQAAVEAVRNHPAFAAKAGKDELAFFRPMPPLLGASHGLPAGRRLIGTSLFSTEKQVRLEIVGVDLADGSVQRLHGGAPPDASPGNHTTCGAPASADQPTAAKGTAGQVWVTVKLGTQTLWRFLAVRPAASSGLRGSGVELRYVDYKGRRVLFRGHVPILNVKYDADKCGPFRDWQYQEGQIQAIGTDVAPGFRLCSSPVQTIMDTGADAGNFLGVGVYVDGLEVVLVSEMQAGWYRYLSEWRLHADGTIRPRFGFAATQDSCVCNIHHHHAYWRLDFDILSAGNNRIREQNRVLCLRRWHELRQETARPRNLARRRKWRVEHVPTGAGYEIRPAATDGIAATAPDAPYGRGDLWFLRYRASELDDGMDSTSGPNTEADIAKWLNGEQLSGNDVVVWYGAHFSHDISHQDSALHGHILGPTLVPVNWPT